MDRKSLLACGVLAPLLYVAMNVIGALQFEGYSVLAHTVSELSAIDAPSRPTWFWLAILYNTLMAAFGAGVWMSAAGRRSVKAAGVLIVAVAVLGYAWPPMHLRGNPATLTDTLHIAWTAALVPMMAAAMGFSAVATGPRMRWFAPAMIVVMILFGALTSLQAPNIATNEPTPTIGLLERVSIAAYLAWVTAFAVALLRGTPARA
jgi:hypothetical membrane protein